MSTTRFTRRLAALALGAATITGLALAGSATAASARVDAGGDHADRQHQRGAVCLTLSSSRRDTDRECGDRVDVDVRRSANTVGIAKRGDRVCVAANRQLDCDQRGWAQVTTRRGFDQVRLLVEDTRLCGRAASDGDWGRSACSDRRGWLTLEADDDIDQISVWTQRRGNRHH